MKYLKENKSYKHLYENILNINKEQWGNLMAAYLLFRSEKEGHSGIVLHS